VWSSQDLSSGGRSRTPEGRNRRANQKLFSPRPWTTTLPTDLNSMRGFYKGSIRGRSNAQAGPASRRFGPPEKEAKKSALLSLFSGGVVGAPIWSPSRLTLPTQRSLWSAAAPGGAIPADGPPHERGSPPQPTDGPATASARLGFAAPHFFPLILRWNEFHPKSCSSQLQHKPPMCAVMKVCTGSRFARHWTFTQLRRGALVQGRLRLKPVSFKTLPYLLIRES